MEILRRVVMADHIIRGQVNKKAFKKRAGEEGKGISVNCCKLAAIVSDEEVIRYLSYWRNCIGKAVGCCLTPRLGVLDIEGVEILDDIDPLDTEYGHSHQLLATSEPDKVPSPDQRDKLAKLANQHNRIFDIGDYGHGLMPPSIF